MTGAAAQSKSFYNFIYGLFQNQYKLNYLKTNLADDLKKNVIEVW